MNERPLALLPELLLLGGAVGGLILGLFLPRARQGAVRIVAAATLVAATIASLAAGRGLAGPVFDDSYDVDVPLTVARIVVCAATLLVLALPGRDVLGHPRETEFYTLLLLAALGTIALAGAADLLLLVAAYLLASVPLYALAGFAKDAGGTEAALKYYLIGAFFGVALLVGVTLLYGAGGGTGYVQLAESLPDAPPVAVAVGGLTVLAGLAFKLGAVPAHFWVPDVTEGASTAVAAFVTTVPKVGAVLAAYRLMAGPLLGAPGDWPLLVAILAAASMTLGNLAAFFQDSVRRLLAYSTISQVGYLLMAVAVAGRVELALPSLSLYAAAYVVTNVGAFAVLAAVHAGPRLEDWRGAARTHPALAVSLVVCLLGLVGTPPTGVFVGKLVVFTAAADGGLGWLVVLAAVNTVASLFYYLRWIAPIFRSGPDGPATSSGMAGWAAVLAAALSVVLGLAAGPLLAAVLDGA
ncbi:MAG: NADH-quinone oxidoreductase subunit N [Geodermatophilaceae bacterium]|nr:NADH-quinone oxidoreductase subunit N [Geodermatophilaceae bacterium]